MVICFHRGHPFLRAFEIKRYIKRDVKMLCKRVNLTVGAPLGNLGGDSLARTFREKRMVYLGFFLGPTGH
jgi:hypothetical protein